MKKRRLPWLLPALLLLWLMSSSGAALAEGEAPSEWTFMMYMCGSDLESKHALASYNMREITSMWFPAQVVANTGDGVELVDWQASGVNLVMQTGGAKQWHGMDVDDDGKSLGVEFATDRLQRFAFNLEYNEDRHGYMPALSLVDEQPLASMARPETLSEFIRWTVAHYPAKKYGLLLWDHGGGSRTGLFVDELFDNDIMYLYELGDALSGAQAHFELIAIDACLMCSLETARTVAPYADFMVASEEVAAGNGSAFAEWMHELYRNPGCSGGELGCEFCDATQLKYAEQSDALQEEQLTYSTIHLDAIGEVAEGFDRLFDFAGQLYESYPSRFNMFCNYLVNAESYGQGGADMIDLGSFLYNNDTMALLDADIRNGLVAALEQAVYYNIKGSGRSASKGLSFCYAPNMTPSELDIYARNCQSAAYVALLDAVNPEWEAPEWVYKKARRLTPIDELEAYQMSLELLQGDGLPRLHVINRGGSLLGCDFNLYFMDGGSGEICSLGSVNAFADWDDELGDAVYLMDNSGHWPAIEGHACCIELIDQAGGVFLYNVPIQIGTDSIILRLRANPRYDEDMGQMVYECNAIGLWQGYDQDTRMPDRSIISFNQMQGREYRLLYPCCDDDGAKTESFQFSDTMTMYRGLEVDYAPLPVGEYYCSFTVRDIFRRSHTTQLVKLSWDGESFG